MCPSWLRRKLEELEKYPEVEHGEAVQRSSRRQGEAEKKLMRLLLLGPHLSLAADPVVGEGR